MDEEMKNNHNEVRSVDWHGRCGCLLMPFSLQLIPSIQSGIHKLADNVAAQRRQ